MIWPMFRFVANKMKWFSADGIAIEKFSRCLKAVQWRKRSLSLFNTILMSSSRLLLRIILFSVYCVLFSLSLWLTNPSLSGHIETISSVAFSPDGQKMLMGSHDDTVTLWDSKSGQVIHKFREHINSVNSVAFSPDGQKMLTGSWDATAILWDVESGQVIHNFRKHKSVVTSVAFSPDGRKLLTGSWDDTTILWDAESGQVIHELKEHKKTVKSVSFSPDGRKLLTGSWDDTAIL